MYRTANGFSLALFHHLLHALKVRLHEGLQISLRPALIELSYFFRCLLCLLYRGRRLFFKRLWESEKGP
jgi:hypothetical protein